ncbi:MAG TPA: hypothetical protein PLV59_02240 [Candidatus Dojkabacteria bacterium]|nr:hypothetical protein [Candidatus Dojkabacteria bacterium]
MDRNKVILSVVLNVILFLATAYLLYFRVVTVKSDEYKLENFESFADVVCEDLKSKGNTGSYLYKWCTDQRITNEQENEAKQLTQTCTSTFYGIDIKHTDKWNCVSANNTVVIKNSTSGIVMNISNAGRGLFCIDGFDDGCKETPFLETELTSLAMYESTSSGLKGEIFGTFPGLSQKGSIPYISIQFSTDKKIGELTEVQKNEIREIIKGITLRGE